jgi:hypothetical protein
MRVLLLALLIGCEGGEVKIDDPSDTDTVADTTGDTTDSPGDTPDDTTPPDPGPEPADNEAPGAAEITIAPPSPDTTSDLVGTFVFKATDPDGDVLTYEWAWLRDGAVVPGLTGDTVPASETQRGETWEARVRAMDPWTAGPSVSAQTVIVNAPPTVTASFLSPPTSGVDLSVLPVASDPDGDAVSVSYAWTLDGTPVNTAAPNTLGGGQVRRGRQIAVRVTADDGQGGVAFTDLSGVAPNQLSVPSASLDPATPTGCVPLVCSPGVGARDADGDVLSATITWTVDGVAWTGAVTTDWPGDTVPAEAQSNGELWACTVTVTDGIDTSAPSTIGGVVTVAPSTESFVVPQPNAADVLVVVDNSGSMGEEQAQLVASFPVLLDALIANGVDFHVGVISTDTDEPTESGRLQEGAGYRYVQPSTPNPSAVFTDMATLGTNGSSDERGRRAVDLALSPPLVTGYNAGFYRPDARLDIIILSDEDDYSGNQPTRAAFIQSLDQLKPDPTNVSFHTLVGPPGGCATAESGTQYAAVRQAVGGEDMNICAANWRSFFSNIAALSGSAPTTYTLTSTPVGPVTVTLTPVGGVAQTLLPITDFYVVGDELVLNDVPPVGATLDVTYACAF